jgi:hypothetical protein
MGTQLNTTPSVTARGTAATTNGDGAGPGALGALGTLDTLRIEVLYALRGPAYEPAHVVPSRWPVLRAHVAGMVRLLWEEGLLERIADPASAGTVPAYRASAAGRRELALLRVDRPGL